MRFYHCFSRAHHSATSALRLVVEKNSNSMIKFKYHPNTMSKTITNCGRNIVQAWQFLPCGDNAANLLPPHNHLCEPLQSERARAAACRGALCVAVGEGRVVICGELKAVYDILEVVGLKICCALCISIFVLKVHHAAPALVSSMGGAGVTKLN